MKKIKQPFLIKLALILLIILLAIFIIKECKILGFCYTIITLISPVFFGYAIAWLIKPIMLKINKHFNVIISSSLTYLILFSVIAIIGYLAAPVMYKEIKDLSVLFINFYENIDPKLLANIDISMIGTKLISWLNLTFNHTKDFLLNIFYSIIIGFFFLTNHESVSRFFAKHINKNLIYDLSINLKSFVKGTVIDTLILFAMSLILFYIIKLPYAFLFAILISLTNIIPYIGPYIGGIPATLVAFGISKTLGLMVLGVVIFLQLIESNLIHPYIMSKALRVNQILIMLSLIICGYFFGVIGMLISAPIVSILKTLYEYCKAHNLIFPSFQGR